MNLEFIFRVIPLIFASAIMMPLAVYIWHSRGREPRARFGALTLFAGSIWMLGYAGELFFIDISSKIIAERVQYLGVVAMPSSWFIYTLHFTGKERFLTRRYLLIYGIVPLITLLLAYTSAYHNLIYTDLKILHDGKYSALRHSNGPWLWFYVCYCLMLLSIAFLAYAKMFFRQHRLYRRQIFIIAFASVIIGLTVIVKQFLPSSIAVEPYAIALITPLVAWALYRLRLGDIKPVAHKVIFDGIADSILLCDNQYRLLDLNNAALHLFGVDARSAIGKSIEDIWPGWPNLGPVLSFGSPPQDVVIDQADQQKIFELRRFQLTDTPQHEAVYLFVLHEVTEKKQAEEKAQQAYQKLKDTQAQLVQSGKLASIGELASGVAHELNQPLTVIRGSAQFLRRLSGQDDGLNEEILSQLDAIERNTTRMMHIINHLRTFSRLSSSGLESVDINKTIEDAFLMVDEQLRIHNIIIEKNLTEYLPRVRGNSTQLEQVFLNMITNARDAMKHGGRLAVVTRLSQEPSPTNRQNPKPPDRCEILFSDQGNGIAEGYVDKIFDPFFTTKTVGKGTGLGLSISYGIVKDHGGEIILKETSPNGTVFLITLPVEVDS
jgi:signal transduction histidine kinase